VVVDFGDGPETFLLDEFCGGGLPVITPMSPLGQALVGAASGQTLTYRTPRGTATVVLSPSTAWPIALPDQVGTLSRPVSA
jgi:hypothetical protein